MRITREQYEAILARQAARRNQAGGAIPVPEQLQRKEALAGCDGREAQGPRCVPVRFTLFRVKLLDVDAKYASVKDLLDCLVASGIVDGDKEGQVDLKVEQVKVKSYKDERTEILVIPNP